MQYISLVATYYEIQIAVVEIAAINTNHLTYGKYFL